MLKLASLEQTGGGGMGGGERQLTVYLSRPSSSAETGNHTFGMTCVPGCELLVISAILGNVPGWDVGGLPDELTLRAGRRSQR